MNRLIKTSFLTSLLLIVISTSLFARPEVDGNQVVFSIHLPDAESVSLAGVFNNWVSGTQSHATSGARHLADCGIPRARLS